MCGIGAMSRATPSSIPDARILGRTLAMRLEERGRHATGFGWIEKAWPHYWKMQGPASQVAFEAPLPVGMQNLIVHTRWATNGHCPCKGAYHPGGSCREVNNHPVVAPGIVLVHNGVLSNDDEIMKMLDYEPMGEVDSEAFAALLSAGPAALETTSVPDLLELVKGNAAIAWLDGSTPELLHLARLSGRPMELGWTRRGDLLMASTRPALDRAAFLAADMTVARYETVPEGTYMTVKAGEIVSRTTFKVQRSAPARTYSGSTYRPTGWSSGPSTTTNQNGSSGGKGKGKGKRKGLKRQVIDAEGRELISLPPVPRTHEYTDADWERLALSEDSSYYDPIVEYEDDSADLDAWWERKMADDPDLAEIDATVSSALDSDPELKADYERIFPGAAAREWAHNDLHALVASWRKNRQPQLPLETGE